jgi:hypothetical protein
VTLGPSGEGGLRAVVTLPGALAVPADEAAPEIVSTRRSDASRLVGMAVRTGRRPRHAAPQTDPVP